MVIKAAVAASHGTVNFSSLREICWFKTLLKSLDVSPVIFQSLWEMVFVKDS